MSATLASIGRRLDRIEANQGFHGEARWMTDAQLMAVVRRGYADLRTEHGSLAAAALALRATGDDGDAAFATLIEEDIGHDAAIH